MKVNLEELFKKRWSLEWDFDVGSTYADGYISIYDEMVDAAVSEGNDEFAVILCPGLLKFIKCECKFPSLRNYFVTGIFNLWKLDFINEKKDLDDSYIYDYSLITFSKQKPKKIRTCVAPEDLNLEYRNEVLNLEYRKQKYYIKHCKEYYKELESYINTSKIPDSLKPLVHEIKYSDYREEVFDARYYSKRFLRISKSISEAKKKCTFVPLKDLVEIIDWRKTRHRNDCIENEKLFNALDFKHQECLYPLNEIGLGKSRIFHAVKKGDIVVSLEGKVYLFAEDSKIVISPYDDNAVLRLKSTWVTPEYLFLYMNSGIFDDINYLSKIMLSQEDSFYSSTWADLENIPIYIPKTDVPMALDKNVTQKYIDIFNQKYRPYLVAEKKLDVVLDEVVTEKMKAGHLISNSDANKRVVELMREVKKSITYEIYNGAVILMGSILEAFFTDWWGNIIDGDFFRDPVGFEFIHGKEQRMDLTFRDAIDNVLKRLKITKRNKEIREKIEKIRAMRDEIHTRVYLKHGTKMTKSICESTLKDLEEIIRLRYDNFQMDSFMKTIAIE